MPFKSKEQRRACYAKQDPNWDCKEWDMKKRYHKNSSLLELYAQPYSGAGGFYFGSLEAYEKEYAKAYKTRRTEEYEIQFINGTPLEEGLFEAMHVSQGNIHEYFEVVESIDENDAVAILWLMEDLSYEVDKALDRADEVIVFEGSVQDYAEQFLDDVGITAELAETYFDWDKLGRELEITGDDVNPTIEDIESLRADGEDDEADRLQEWVDAIEEKSTEDRAQEFVESIGGLEDALGKRISEYFDYEAFARDMELSGDVSTFRFDGTDYVIGNPQDF